MHMVNAVVVRVLVEAVVVADTAIGRTKDSDPGEFKRIVLQRMQKMTLMNRNVLSLMKGQKQVVSIDEAFSEQSRTSNTNTRPP
jgi:ABC-type cobalamin/Fe3+-siderophores transport system ATPase subunit